MQNRFPVTTYLQSAETQARLKTATLEQLEQWVENMLDAATLEDVFKNH